MKTPPQLYGHVVRNDAVELMLSLMKSFEFLFPQGEGEYKAMKPFSGLVHSIESMIERDDSPYQTGLTQNLNLKSPSYEGVAQHESPPVPFQCSAIPHNKQTKPMFKYEAAKYLNAPGKTRKERVAWLTKCIKEEIIKWEKMPGKYRGIFCLDDFPEKYHAILRP